MARQPDKRSIEKSDPPLEGEVLEALPSNHTQNPDSRNDAGRIVAASYSYSGPIPHPSIIQGYEQALPGAADRVLTLVEKQSEHRQQLEKAHMQHTIQASTRGTYCAVFITMAGFGLAGYLGYLGLGYPAVGVVLTSVSGLVGVFALGRQKQREELDDKKAELESPPKRRAPKQVESKPEEPT